MDKEEGGGGGFGGGLGFGFLLIIIAGGIYGMYLRSMKTPAAPAAPVNRPPSVQGFLEWLIPGYKAAKPADQNTSPYSGQVKIVAVVPKTETSPMQIMLVRITNNSIPLAGWIIKSNTGSQIIGLEGQSSASPLRITVLHDFVKPDHDRLILYDGQWRYVDQYAY